MSLNYSLFVYTYYSIPTDLLVIKISANVQCVLNKVQYKPFVNKSRKTILVLKGTNK